MDTLTSTLQPTFIPLAIAGCDAKEKLRRIRINSLGSLYYFTKVALRRARLTESLHLPLALSLERKYLKDVYELPRDHFKSTLCSEALPMWWALPFTTKEEDEFLKLGYSDEYINHLRTVHSPLWRTLLVSENITNAAKLGKRIRYHFESNAVFRGVFSDILPTTDESWTAFSLTVNRKPFGTAAHGEGTFDFIGVGGALQSRHYDAIIQDDIVGRKAIESQSIMDGTIEYHKLLIGAFDTQDALHDNSELIIGNRWGFHDLNSYIRENEDWFVVHSHSALGGCCTWHDADTPIFPEEFSFEKLMRWKKRLGAYHFSCQFLNNPISPEDADFQLDYLNYFSFEREHNTGRLQVNHEPKNGVIRKKLSVGHLSIAMAVDPNHGGNAGSGRCRHAIVVVGKNENDYYLLEAWAAAISYGAFVDKIYEVARRWKLRKFGLETVAAQKYLKFHLDQKNIASGLKLTILPLEGEVEAPDGTMTRKKEWRIRNVLSPLFENGQFFVQRKHQDFIAEYQTFPRGKFVDQLDALAYIPQMLKYNVSHAQSLLLLQRNQERAKLVNKPYAYSNTLRVH
jgi:hypothetical protein